MYHSSWSLMSAFVTTLFTVSLCQVLQHQKWLDHQYRRSVKQNVDSAGACVNNIEAIDHLRADDMCGVANAPFTPEQKTWFERFSPSQYSKRNPVVRKDFRLMSEEELDRFFHTFVQMKEKFKQGNMSEFDVFTKVHDPRYAPGQMAKSGIILGWHRLYQLYYERAMQSHDTEVTMPFWDLTLDIYLPNLRDSIIFSDEFFGDCGLADRDENVLYNLYQKDENLVSVKVENGKFKNWELTPNCFKDLSSYSNTVKRTCVNTNDNSRNGFITTYNDKEIDLMLSKKSYTELSQMSCLVSDHDGIHKYLGQTNNYQNTYCSRVSSCCSVVDPVVWFLHTAVDFIWETHRQVAQETNTEKDFPNKLYPCHKKDADIQPFYPLKNIDALSKDFTTYFYIYEKTPTMCDSDHECASKYLWCDVALRRCKSKLRSGGNCFGHPNKACFSEKCNLFTNKCA